MLGHASITLTMDMYSHVLPGMQEESAARLEDPSVEGTVVQFGLPPNRIYLINSIDGITTSTDRESGKSRDPSRFYRHRAVIPTPDEREVGSSSLPR